MQVKIKHNLIFIFAILFFQQAVNASQSASSWRAPLKTAKNNTVEIELKPLNDAGKRLAHDKSIDLGKLATPFTRRVPHSAFHLVAPSKIFPAMRLKNISKSKEITVKAKPVDEKKENSLEVAELAPELHKKPGKQGFDPLGLTHLNDILEQRLIDPKEQTEKPAEVVEEAPELDRALGKQGFDPLELTRLEYRLEQRFIDYKKQKENALQAQDPEDPEIIQELLQNSPPPHSRPHHKIPRYVFADRSQRFYTVEEMFLEEQYRPGKSAQL